MEQLMMISSVGFVVCTILAVVGVGLSIYTFWKYDIREVFIIRSGRGLKRAVLRMENQRSVSGTIRSPLPEADSDIRKTSKNKVKKTDVSIEAKTVAPETLPLDSAPETMPLHPAAETVPLYTAAETVSLNQSTEYAAETIQLQQSQSAEGSIRDSDKYENTGNGTGGLSGERAEFSIVSEEIETHTDETIEPVKEQ